MAIIETLSEVSAATSLANILGFGCQGRYDDTGTYYHKSQFSDSESNCCHGAILLTQTDNPHSQIWIVIGVYLIACLLAALVDENVWPGKQ
ncbi:hypothetical protein Tco_0924399 [Tanacetum coccineum]|uniref:Uncharacterized protein n=1 Tax=Tanacetum coccineum TaxID=301880 RepID=A0ABQ5D3Q6_9ASTR